MKSNSGAAPTQTPPKPTSMPLTRFSPSIEDGALLESAVAVHVFEDEDAVLAFSFRLLIGIAVRLRHPEAAALIDGKGDGLLHLRLGGDQFRLKAGRQHHARDDLLRLGVGHRRGLGGIRLQMPEHRAFLLARAVRSSRSRRGGAAARRTRLLVVKDKVIEIQMAPALGALIDEPHEDALAGVRPQIHDLAPHVLRIRARWRCG